MTITPNKYVLTANMSFIKSPQKENLRFELNVW